MAGSCVRVWGLKKPEKMRRCVSRRHRLIFVQTTAACPISGGDIPDISRNRLEYDDPATLSPSARVFPCLSNAVGSHNAGTTAMNPFRRVTSAAAP